MEAPLIEFAGVTFDFDVSRPPLRRLLSGEPRRRIRAVNDVSFAIRRGTTLSLVGESGCGKSTIARLAVGLYTPKSGEIRFGGQNIVEAMRQGGARRQMNMIFQDPFASLNPRWRAADIIAEPIRTFGLEENEASVRRQVEILLTGVGMAAADGDKYPHEFSGGQRQRISIARALASEPVFLVCDEPTSSLDVSVQAQILNMMMDLQQRLGLTYLFISHNLAVVRQMSDTLGVMYLGRIIELGSAETIYQDPLHPYTKLLLDAIPDLNQIGRARPPVHRDIPGLISPPAGCAFHPRCPLADARCREESPRPHKARGRITACHAVEQGRVK